MNNISKGDVWVGSEIDAYNLILKGLMEEYNESK